MKPVIRYWVVVTAIAVAVMIVIMVAGTAFLKWSYCETTQLSVFWSADHAYRAILFKKGCGMGNPDFYNFTVDRNKPGEGVLYHDDVDFDGLEAQRPELRWVGHRLTVNIPTEALRGSLEQPESDFTVVKVWTPVPQH